jgi:hypothetical protein
MSKYTYQLRNVILFTSLEEVKSWLTDYDLADYLTTDQLEVVTEAGLFNKEKLADRIINHYYMREIGVETIGLFKLKIKTKLDLLMEKYAPLIYTNSIEYDILVNEDYTETFNRSTSGTDTNTNTSAGSNSTTSSGSGLTVSSDTPQGQISKATILAGQYATSTSAGENTNTTSTTDSVTNNSSGSNSGTETFTRRVKGNRGISATYQAMIKQYRENILTIYNDIINDLNDLFMGIW